MTLPRFRRVLLLALSAGAVSAGIGCFGADDEAGESPDAVKADDDTSRVLRSMLLLDIGCAATKVGPKHLLVAASCVSGNSAVAPGKTITYTLGSEAARDPSARPRPRRLDAPEPEATEREKEPASDPEKRSAAASEKKTAEPSRDPAADKSEREPVARSVVVNDVSFPDSFQAKCKKKSACGIGKVEASDSPDVAVITIEEELSKIRTIPIDLDEVKQGDPLLVVGSGCAAFDDAPRLVTKVRTDSVPAKSVNHKGSGYRQAPQFVSRLDDAYIVTAARGWRSSAVGYCQSDLGAPLFRSDVAAVVGVLANITSGDATTVVPFTALHTRVDEESRFKIGEWLASLGVETVHACGDDEEVCRKDERDASAPDYPDFTAEDASAPYDASDELDGGTVEGSTSGSGDTWDFPPDPNNGRPQPLPPEDDEEYEKQDYSDAAVKKDEKKKGGCSAAPRDASPRGGGAALVALGVGLFMAARRRRDEPR